MPRPRDADEDLRVIDPGRQLVAERVQDRDAWEVRRQGTLEGIVWQDDRRSYRAAFERGGRMTQIPRSFGSVEEAARALDRTAR